MPDNVATIFVAGYDDADAAHNDLAVVQRLEHDGVISGLAATALVRVGEDEPWRRTSGPTIGHETTPELAAEAALNDLLLQLGGSPASTGAAAGSTRTTGLSIPAEDATELRELMDAHGAAVIVLGQATLAAALGVALARGHQLVARRLVSAPTALPIATTPASIRPR